MSAVVVLTPIVIAAWPAFSSAVVAAAASMGFQVATEKGLKKFLSSAGFSQETTGSVNLEIDRSEVVTGSLGRDEAISVTRDGVTVKFARDPRGKASLCVTGAGHSDEELRAIGEQLSKAVVQQYVYQKLMGEMQARGFNVVEEEVAEDRSIRLKVRHWEA
jgi:predicted secreted protein